MSIASPIISPVVSGMVRGIIPGDAFRVYVATDGDDANAGTMAAPVETLDQAQTLMRAEISANGAHPGGMEVIIREGDYQRTSSLALTSLDEGTSSAPVKWKGAPGETVRILGGEEVNPAWFSLMDSEDTRWADVPAAAQGEVYLADLDAQGITDYGTLAERGFYKRAVAALELFVDENPAQVARWPKDDGTHSASSLMEFESSDGVTEITLASGSDAAARMANWNGRDDVWFHGLWKYFWSDGHINVFDDDSIDSVARTITLAVTPRSGLLTTGDRPFYVYNLLEELSEAGEYYMDRAAGILYYWPDGTLANQELLVSMIEEPLITVTGADYIEIENITFGFGRQHLLTVSGGSNVTVRDCKFLGAGNDGVQMDGDGHRLLSSEVSDSGDMGVHIEGGDIPTLTDGGNTVYDCHIHGFQRWSWMYGPGVFIEGYGHTAEYNHIHDAAHTGLHFKGCDHTITLNKINDLCYFAADAGAVYCGNKWHHRGNLVHRNFIHDITSDIAPSEDVHGIYMDDMFHGTTVTQNYLVNIQDRGIFQGGGRDVTTENNIIVDCATAFGVDSRGLDYIDADPPTSGGHDYFQMILDEGVDYQDATWTAAYPDLAALSDDYADWIAGGSTLRYPEGSTFVGNAASGVTFLTVQIDYGGTGTLASFDDTSGNKPTANGETQATLDFVDYGNYDLNMGVSSDYWDLTGAPAQNFFDEIRTET